MQQNVQLIGKELAHLIKRELDSLTLIDLVKYSRSVPKITKVIAKFGRTIHRNKLIRESIQSIGANVKSITDDHVQYVSKKLSERTGLSKQHLEQIASTAIIAAGSALTSNISGLVGSTANIARYTALPLEEIALTGAIDSGLGVGVGTSMFAAEEFALVAGGAGTALELSALGPMGLAILGGIATNELVKLLGIY